jgi:polar amino acid transport system permease protein
MDISIIKNYFPVLLKGSLTTVELTFISMILGSLIALLIAFAKISKNNFFKVIGSFYTWFFRGTPLLMQLFVIYYGLPQIGIKFEPFTAAVVGLTLNISAYIAEVIRGAVESIDKCQWEAAATEGMNYWQTVFVIILPQSYRRMIPPMTNEFIALIKDTSLVSTIAMVDLMRTAQQMVSTSFKPLEIFFIAAILYLTMTTVFTTIFKYLEGKVSYE